MGLKLAAEDERFAGRTAGFPKFTTEVQHQTKGVAMGQRYSQLTLEERRAIARLQDEGRSGRGYNGHTVCVCEGGRWIRLTFSHRCSISECLWTEDTDSHASLTAYLT